MLKVAEQAKIHIVKAVDIH